MKYRVYAGIGGWAINGIRWMVRRGGDYQVLHRRKTKAPASLAEPTEAKQKIFGELLGVTGMACPPE